MEKRTRKRMAKAGLRTPNGNGAVDQKRELKKQIREQKEISALCKKLERATANADDNLNAVRIRLQKRAVENGVSGV